jgi:integrase/recombinase XerD
MRKKRKRSHRPATPTLPGSIGAYGQEYCSWLEERNYSPQTVAGRRLYLTLFADWCTDHGLLEPAEVTKPVIERYQRYLFHYRKKNGEPLSFRSQHVQMIPVKSLFRWLSRQNYILNNPASEIELPQREKRLPKHVLSSAEAEAVLLQPDTRQPIGIRDRAILETFYSTGMRRTELIKLKLCDIDFERGTVMVRQGKGRKDRLIPVGEQALAWMRKYLDEVRPQFAAVPDTGFVFLTAESEALSPNRLTQIVREYVSSAGIDKQGSCHLFRHTCATLMLENGADIRFIQQLLGHSDLSTTQIYTQVSIRKLKEIHTLTHPSAKLKKRQNNNPDQE